MYIKVSVYSNDLMSLKERKKYIEKLYPSPVTYSEAQRKHGLILKFNNAIGFKPVTTIVDNRSVVHRPAEEIPEGYETPEDLIFEHMRTPLESFNILEFYIPVKKVKHPKQQFAYKTEVAANKWIAFLQKVWPELEVSKAYVEEVPKLSLREFAFQYFFKCLDFSINYTIEFSSVALLTKEDIDYILPKLQTIAGTKIAVHQYPCEVCKYNTFGEKDIHIELVYGEVAERALRGEPLYLDEEVPC